MFENFVRLHCGESSPAVAVQPVRLYARDSRLRTTRNRVQLSAGTGPAEEIDPAGPPRHPSSSSMAERGRYREDALLPRAPWRAPEPVELEALWCDKPQAVERTVGLVQIFEPNPFNSTGAQHELFQTFDYSDPNIWSQPLMKWLLDEIRRHCAFEGATTYRGVAATAPGCITSTYVRPYDAYFGMHVDDGEHVAIAHLHTVRNRISVNIGSVDRYLLFVNLVVSDMMAMLGRDVPPRAAPYTPGQSDDIGRQFLRRYPSYPVLKLRLRPGEAYVASTENLLHDGSSVGITELGKQVIFFGRFACAA